MNSLLFCFLGMALPRDLSATILRDVGVQSRDSHVVLGMGYSSFSGQFVPPCIDTSQVSAGQLDPRAFNYDYILENIETNTVIDGFEQRERHYMDLSMHNFVFDTVSEFSRRDSISNELKSIENASYTKIMFSMITVDKFHSTIDDENMNLISPALSLVQNTQLVDFFHTCGPSFVRSIRKTAQFASLFSYRSNIQGLQDGFYRFLRDALYSVEGEGVEVSQQLRTVSSKSESSSLNIRIRASGIQMSDDNENQGDLIATDLSGYFTVLETAFEAMVMPGGGVTRSLEVVPWSRSLYFMSFLNIVVEVEGEVSNTMKKYNLLANAEFLNQINDIMNLRLNFMSKLTRCTNEALAFPSTYGRNYIVNNNCLTGDCTEVLTVNELRCTLLGESSTAPSSQRYRSARMILDFGVLTQNYFTPCSQALSRTRAEGLSIVTQNFLSVEQCQHLECLSVNAVWQSDGGCLPDDDNSIANLLDDYCPLQLSSGIQPVSEVNACADLVDV